jgi:hypothetical protein
LVNRNPQEAWETEQPLRGLEALRIHDYRRPSTDLADPEGWQSRRLHDRAPSAIAAGAVIGFNDEPAFRHRGSLLSCTFRPNEATLHAEATRAAGAVVFAVEEMMGMSVEDRQYPARVYDRILRNATKVRADVLRTRIMVLDAFCATAETQVRLNFLDHARISVEKIRHAHSEIEHHLQDSHHVSGIEVSELRAILKRVKSRIESLETSTMLAS